MLCHSNIFIDVFLYSFSGQPFPCSESCLLLSLTVIYLSVACEIDLMSFIYHPQAVAERRGELATFFIAQPCMFLIALR